MKTKVLSKTILISFLKLLWIPICAFCVSSCFGAGMAPPREVGLVTGECLKDTHLIHRDVGFDPGKQRGVSGSTSFVIGFDMSLEYVSKKRKLFLYYVRPSNEAFRKFGWNEGKVRTEYDRILDKLPVYIGRDDVYGTFLYNGGVVLTADKDFAGIPKGENLAELFQIKNDIKELDSIRGEVKKRIGIPFECENMVSKYGFSLVVPKNDDYKMVRDQVSFTLKMPFRVVNYLQWINDKISDPTAPVPYSDTEFTCEFITRYRLVPADSEL